MAALAGFGLAANILGFLDVSNAILSRLWEYGSSARDLPQDFRGISTRLPVINESMLEIKKQLKDGSLSPESQQKLSSAVEGFHQSISQLDNLLTKLLPASSDSLCSKMKRAIASINKEKEIEKIQKELDSYSITFTLHFESHRPDISTASTTRGDTYTYYEVPSLQVSHYIERPDLFRSIQEGLEGATASKDRQRLVVLLGMGGSGKTQLALEYCRILRSSEKFKAILWIDASSSTTLASDFDRISQKLNFTCKSFRDTEEKIDFVKATLESWEKPSLLVFDNFDRLEAFQDPGIDKYLPAAVGIGEIIFTTRNPECERLGLTIKVSQMTEDEGLKLLLLQSKNEQNDESLTAAKEIVKKLGYLPLAIDQAAAYISARKLPLNQFIKQYNERKETVLKTTPSLWEYRKKLSNHEAKTSLSVFTTFELSFSQIGGSRRERRAIEHALTLSAFINARDVSESLFHTYIHKTSLLPCWIRYFLRKGEWNHYKFEDALTGLSNLSLLQKSGRARIRSCIYHYMSLLLNG